MLLHLHCIALSFGVLWVQVQDRQTEAVHVGTVPRHDVSFCEAGTSGRRAASASSGHPEVLGDPAAEPVAAMATSMSHGLESVF
eukprot:Skav224900  [mRNA]  locus=scaffold1112:412807:413058:+ [translate_table: standard]